MRKILLFALIGMSCVFAKAQKDSSVTAPAKTKYRYLGIQANLLLQQFISFNSNASINSNPYIFSCSTNNIKTGHGSVFGTGFGYNDNTSNDGVASLHTQNLNLSFRAGYERKYLQNERFIPFWGIEGGAGVVYTLSESTLNQSITNNKTRVETTKIFLGPSFRGGVNYALSKHVLIGTEFFFNVQIAMVETTSSLTNFGTNSVAPFNVGFQAPTALFLIFRY